MGYPRKLLNEGEDIVLDLNPHWRIFLAPAGLLVIALALLLGVTLLIDDVPTAVVVLAAVPLVLGVLWFGYRYTEWRTTHFVVTTDRVIYRSGIVAKAGQNIPLEGITNVGSSQTALERLLRVGDLTIESAGESGRQTFRDVLHPSKVENRIYAEIENAQVRDERRAATAGLSVADELAKLEQLRRQGIISDADFEQQKRRLLNP